MKNAVLPCSLTLVLCIGMAIPAGASQFQDVPDGHWASDAVDYVVEKGLFNGTSATTFSPRQRHDPGHAHRGPVPLRGLPAVTGTVASETPLPGHPRRGVLWGRCGVGLPERHLPPIGSSPRTGGTITAPPLPPDSPTPRMDFAQMLYQFSLYLTGKPWQRPGRNSPLWT